MKLNNMNEFTLSTALNSIRKHLLVTVALFSVVFWGLPSLNILDNQYIMKKTIHLGAYEPGHVVDLLNFKKIHAIVKSDNTSIFLNNALESEVAQFSISENAEKNIILVLKSHSHDKLVNTANLIMKRLQEFDEAQIQNKIDELNNLLSDKRKVLEILVSSDDKYILSNADIEQYASMQKIYDTAYSGLKAGEASSDINGLMRLKRESINRKVNLEQTVITIKQEIEKLELIKEKGFKKVSYLYPVSADEAGKYFPNNMVFFAISLFAAFFYNLIMLNIKFNKSSR